MWGGRVFRSRLHERAGASPRTMPTEHRGLCLGSRHQVHIEFQGFLRVADSLQNRPNRKSRKCLASLVFGRAKDVLTRPCRLHPPGMSQCAKKLAGAWQSCSGFIQRQMRRPNSHSLIELPNNAQGCRKISEWTFQPPWKVREMGGQCYGQLVRSSLSVLFLGFLLLNRLKSKMHDIPRIVGWRPGSGQ